MNNYRIFSKLTAFFLLIFMLTGIYAMGQSKKYNNDSSQLASPMAIPTVTTSSATGIDASSATLNGFVNANNEDSTVIFEYSTNANFPDAETPPPNTIAATPSPVTGSGFTAISANLTGLSPGTVYYFRAVATNASGTTYGSILTFFTDPPATVTTGIASPVTTTTATLNGIVNANSNSTTVTFEYGLTTAYGTTVTADQSPVTGTTDTAVSKSISGLTSNTTYHFRVVGVNANGTSNGEDRTFFTSAQTAPTVTTDYATYSIIPNTAMLNGTVNANNADATVTFEYGTTTAYGTTVTADQSPVLGSTDTAVSKFITGLTPNTTYHYRVVGTNGIGTTNGADMTFFNTTAPYARTEAASAIGNTTATVNGTVNPKISDLPVGTTTVTFEWGLTAAYGNSAAATQSPIEGNVEVGVSLNLTGLTPNTMYHYRVVANNVNGTGTGADMTFTTNSFPVVTTNTAAPVGTNSATLNGTVNANGDSTTVTFEYGLTTSYGTTVTADQSPVTGTTNTWVSKAISGLANNTLYHYRVVGTNSSGTSNGNDMTFTTGLMPPSVSTNAATGVGTTTATMNGTVNANGQSTTVSFEWGETIAYSRTDPATPNTVTGNTNTPVSFTATTLLPNTTYHYRAVGQSAGGTIYGADMTFTTAASPTVTTNAATSVTATGATLNGTVNANGSSSTVTFEYGTTTAYGTTVTADQSPVTGTANTAVSKAITGLTLSITYHFRAVGTNASGTSYGADMTFFTSAPSAPGVTTNAASSVVFNGATLNGTVNANNASTTVTFEYGTTMAYGTTVTADQSPVTGATNTAVSKTITGLTGNTTYHYRVAGTNVNGTSYGADMTFTTDALTPTAITGAATNVLYSSATVHGTANGNLAGAVVTFEYGLTTGYGATVSAVPNLIPGDEADYAVYANLTGLTPGTTYHYRVVADNAFVTPVNGADMTFTTPIGPDAVTDAATGVGATSATLNGRVNAQNASTTVTFEYGLTTSYGLTVFADQSPVTGNTITAVSNTLTSLTPNTTYHYRVVAQNVNGTRYGGNRSFSTPGAPPTADTNAATAVTNTGATLNGTVNANNDSTTVTFEYGTTTSYGTTVTADQSPVTGTNNTAVSKAITGLINNTTYHYRVVGQNGSGTTNGADMTFFTGIAAPTVTTAAATSIGPANATLNGTVNANNDSTTVTFQYGETTAYGRTATASQSPLTGSTDTAVSAAVTLLNPNTAYHYRAVGQNAGGTTYGADMTFITNPANAPTVTTANVSNIAALSSTGGGNVTAEGGSPVSARGVCWSTVPNPTTADNFTLDGTGPGAFTSSLTGLSELTTYYVRAYATNTFGTSYGNEIMFTTNPIFTPTVNTENVTNITSSSAVSGGNVADDGGSPVIARGVCWSNAPNPTIANNKTFNGTGTGSYASNLFNLSPDTTYYVRAYATNSAGTAYGLQLQFTTGSTTVTVAITQPDQDETVSGIVTIAADASVARDSSSAAQTSALTIIKVEFYIDDIIIGTVASAPYETDWDSTTVSDGSHTIKAVAYDDNGNTGQDEITVTVNQTPAGLQLNRDKFNFGAIQGGGPFTGPQILLINRSGEGSLNWSIGFTSDWLSCTPASGSGAGVVSVSVDASGLAPGNYSDTISVINNNASGTSATVPVNLTVYPSGTTTSPFGVFSTPLNNSTVMSSIPVTGWVLDDIEVTSVEIYRSPVSGEGSGMVYIGDAVLVDGARPDVEQSYPDYPLNYQAGWGYMMLTNFLPNSGNGTFTLYAKATDKEGNTVTLGSKSITVDNDSAVKPFGAIDTPTQGGSAIGSSFVNFGWALTPLPNTIPFDGSTIKVFVDGVALGNPVYNQYREDIATLFPGYNNSDGAIGYFYLDTTAYINGVHTIAWSVKDDAGNVDGVGSRYFSILNVGSSRAQSAATAFPDLTGKLDTIPFRFRGSVNLKRGPAAGEESFFLVPDERGITAFNSRETERIEIPLGRDHSGLFGYLLVNNKLRSLPTGSTLNPNTGTFSWWPGPGYLGKYTLVFITKDETGQFYKEFVEINILPKFDR
jgi:phosphodiesterase/alkaline phosphatase D-like protein